MIVNNYSDIRVFCGVVVFFISFNFSNFMVVMRVISLQAVWCPSKASSIFQLHISNAKHLLCHSLSTVSELIRCILCDNLRQTGAMQLEKRPNEGFPFMLQCFVLDFVYPAATQSKQR